MGFWNDFIYFFSFKDANITNVLLGTLMLGFTCGIVGVLAVLNKKALIVDAVSQSSSTFGPSTPAQVQPGSRRMVAE